MKHLIAILDDGLHEDIHPDALFRMRSSGGVVCRASDAGAPQRSYGHGDICAQILRNHALNARFGSVQVLDGASGQGKADDLISAVDWCVNNGISIIHMSLGSVDAADCLPLYACMKRAYEAGVILVAACKNGRQTAFPASFPFVLGVKTDFALSGAAYYPNAEPFSGIDFVASSDHPLGHMALPSRSPKCNSYAAPLITAKIWNMLQREPGLALAQIKERLGLETDMRKYIPHAWDGENTMEVHRFVREIIAPAGAPTAPVAVVLLAGEEAPAWMLALSRALMQRNQMPLLLTQKGGRKPYGLHRIDQPAAVMRHNAALAEWFGANIILLEISQDVANDWADGAPNMLICNKVLGAGRLSKATLANGGAVLRGDALPVDALCTQALALLAGNP